VARLKLLVAIAVIQLSSLVGAQSAAIPPIIDLPREAVTRIPSPDRKWTLIFECPDYGRERKLWIEDKAHARRHVRDFERSLSISWAPDSHLCVVNDASGSTETLSYVYDPVTLNVTDLAKVLIAGDHKAEDYIGVGHSYLEAKRWVNSHELLVALHGHYDEPPPRGFTLRYRVDLRGKVRKVYERLDGDWR
jgi:hypothetical protein